MRLRWEQGQPIESLPSTTSWRGWGWFLLFPLARRARRRRLEPFTRRQPLISLRDDILRDAFAVAHHVAVPIAQQSPTGGGKIGRAPDVMAAVGVLSAVELDDQARTAAGEVRDIRPDGVLPREARAQPSEDAPEQALGIGRIATKMPREFDPVQALVHALSLNASARRMKKDHPLPPPRRRGGGAGCAEPAAEPPTSS